jgi:hypothetical protein
MNGVARGTVYGTLLNFRGELEALGTQDERSPVQGPAEGAGAVREAGKHLERERRRHRPAGRSPSLEMGATVAW